jgi:uncharacterized protein YcbX
MAYSLSLPPRPESTNAASSPGFPQAALTFLNRQTAVSPTLAPAWGKCGKGLAETEEAGSQIRVRRRDGNLLRSRMSMIPPAKIAGLYRYPVKGLSGESLPSVALGVGQTLAADRRYAIENGPSGFDPAAPAWLPKFHYLMLMRNERLAGLQTHFEDHTNLFTIREGGRISARGDLETAQGRAAIEAFFAKNFASELKGPPKVLSGGGHSFSDVAKKVVSIINLGSLAAIEQLVGQPVHPLRFLANLYVSGWPAWQESGLLGQTLEIGETRLKIVKRITRCAAVNVDPESAARDLDIPPALLRRFGHNECGVYAEVIAGGTIGVGDAIATEAPRLL